MKAFISASVIVIVLGIMVGLSMPGPGNELNLNIPIHGMKEELGKCQVEILDIQDSIVGNVARFIYVNKDYYSLPVHIKLSKKVEDYDLLRARIKFKKIEQVYSLYQLQDRMIVKILGQDNFIMGTEIAYRVIVRNQRSSEPLPGAKVKIYMKDKDNNKEVFSGITDNSGTCPVSFSVPADLNEAALVFEVVSDIGKDTYETRVKFTSGNLTYLVTDKPMYQPGQTVHMRTVSLSKPDLDAIKGRELIFEVEDSKGNKVFKKAVTTDDFGVAYVPFLIADEVNFGNYTIRAVLENDKIEKTVKVEKYVLPKFKVSLRTDKEFYLPAEKLEGDIDVQYFFGKPVAEGKVKITVFKFDIGFNQEAQIEGRTDKDGLFHFTYALPEYFVGEPLEKGDAFIRLDIEVIDKANHNEKVSLTKKIVQDVINLAIVPEGGAFKPNLENRFYVLASYPDGMPCVASVDLAIDGQKMTGRTDEFGVAEFLFTPRDNSTSITATARDDKGETVQIEKEFASDIDRDQLIMRMARGIYKVGDAIDLQFLATKKTGRVYLDVIKDNQTMLTKSITINSGRGNYKLNLTPDITGSIWFHAYTVTPGSDIVRDTRFCYVHSATDLAIDVKPDKKEYLPGEDGSILFTVTDNKGAPRIAAICLAVVDEAVFAVSELQPGLEKVYFMLEKEIMTPRYEIHGFEPADIVKKPGIQERAENVMFSTLVPKEPFPVNYTTPQEVNSKIKQTFYTQLSQLRDKLYAGVNKYYEKHNEYPKTENGLEILIESGYLKARDLLDPWARKYRVTSSEEYFYYFNVVSAGPDGVFDNEDDINEWGGGWDEDRFGMEEAGVPVAGAQAPRAERAPVMSKTGAVKEKLSDKKAGAPGEEPRIREYFPETFIFEPALVTDQNGKASLDVSLPDAITTWRVTAFASTQGGDLGSVLAQIKVFQDFFVDIDLPVALTQGDEISIPIALYNYLPKKQDIKLVLQAEEWFDIKENSEVTKTLNRDEVSVVYFPIRVKKIGYHSITVKAYGEVKSDAIKRQIEVLPDGKKFEEIISDRLEKEVLKRVSFPDNAIAEANHLILKLYPGIYSQVVEGLDKMLGMPFGCFEQTASVTYPNILILDYLRQTEQAKPETEMQAEEYISVGYQRMLSFEVKSGGFSWFGDEPANRVLTAYGLMAYNHMSKVYEIDERVISRTAQWLKAQQNSDGSWSPDKQYLHAESWTRIQHSEIMPTAYIVWALGEIGEKGDAAAKGLDFLKKNLGKVNDPYILSLVANAFVAMEPKGEKTIEVLRKLVDMAKEEDGAIYWESSIPSLTFSEGKGGDIEASGLATYALVRSGKFSDITTKALTYIIRAKDAYGTWHTTQGTVICLRALVAALGGSAEDVDARVIVKMNGKKIKEVKVDNSNADVMQQIDLDESLQKDNTIELEMQGDGNFLYEITSAFYIPWKDLPRPATSLFAIDVNYDRTKLGINDLVNVDVSIKLTKPGTAQMVMIDLGIPPGFEVQTPTLDEHVGKKIQKYSLTPRQIIVYVEAIESGIPVEFSYSLKAKYPIKAQVRASRVYEYYNLDKEAVEEPFQMQVTM